MGAFFRNLLHTILRPDPPGLAGLETFAWMLDQGREPGTAAESAWPDRPDLPGRLATGAPLAHRLPELGLLTPAEGALLVPFEEAGRLPLGLQALTRLLRERHTALRGILARASYPLLVLHLAALAIHIPSLMHRAAAGAVLLRMGLTLLALGAGLLLLGRLAARAWRSGSLERWPLVGPWFLSLEKGRALLVLEVCHGAGVLWDRALDLTAGAIASPTLRRRLHAARATIGCTGEPGAVLFATLDLPAFCRGFLESGQVGGELEKGLRECREALERLARDRRGALVTGLGAGLYTLAVIAVVAVALRVFGVYLDLLGRY